jgi:hypothetical protein
VPLADSIGSPKHVSADYYYRIPVRPIYKSYPVYAPGQEPSGYMDWLKQQEPVILWDDNAHRPALKTKADWIKAGEIAFDAPTALNVQFVVTLTEVRDPTWYGKTGTPVAKDGTMAFARYFIRKRGNIEVGAVSCATCHTCVLSDGSILKGAQGSFPFDRSLAFSYRYSVGASKEPAQALSDVRATERSLYAVPWLRPNLLADLDRMPADNIAARHEAIPPGVIARHRASVLYPPHIPDLIGVKDRTSAAARHRGPDALCSIESGRR